MLEAIQPIILAILGAIMYALTGYAKQYTTESFDEEKFVVTIFIGFVVGIASYLLGITFDPAYQLLISTGIIVAVENVAKAVYRRYKLWVEDSKLADIING